MGGEPQLKKRFPGVALGDDPPGRSRAASRRDGETPLAWQAHDRLRSHVEHVPAQQRRQGGWLERYEGCARTGVRRGWRSQSQHSGAGAGGGPVTAVPPAEEDVGLTREIGPPNGGAGAAGGGQHGFRGVISATDPLSRPSNAPPRPKITPSLAKLLGAVRVEAPPDPNISVYPFPLPPDFQRSADCPSALAGPAGASPTGCPPAVDRRAHEPSRKHRLQRA